MSQTLRVIHIDLLTEYILGTLEMRQQYVQVGVSRKANCTTTRTNCTCSLSCLRVPQPALVWEPFRSLVFPGDHKVTDTKQTLFSQSEQDQDFNLHFESHLLGNGLYFCHPKRSHSLGIAERNRTRKDDSWDCYARLLGGWNNLIKKVLHLKRLPWRFNIIEH